MTTTSRSTFAAPPAAAADPAIDGAGNGGRQLPSITGALVTRGTRLGGEHHWTVSGLVGLGVAIACALFVFVQMRPDLLLADTTPAGGDMGAHVWGPAYLRDHLLSQGQLAGWTPDWYAGFPAYHFYMVVPSLAIVAVNAGLRPLLGVPVAALIIGLAVFATRGSDSKVRTRLIAAALAVLVIAVPYGISFKLVSVAGLVSFPLAAWAMGRLARAPEPIPAFLSLAATIFLFDTNFTIYGGNIASTLAGEFAFSISLSFCLLAIGLTIRGMDTGTWRAPAAAVIALIALTHVIPVFFILVAMVALVVLDRSVPRLWPVAIGVALALIPVAFADGTSRLVSALAVGAALVVLLAVVATERSVRQRAVWLVVTGPTAAALSCFWLLPFYLREPFFNDMGWERLNEISPAMLTVPMKIALPVAAIGALLAFAMRERIGLLFSITALVFAAAVANLGEGPLWNARLLPFYYLSIYLLAAVGVALAIRFAAVAVAEDYLRPDRRVEVAATLVGLLVTVVAVGVPLRLLPFGSDQEDGSWRWLAFTSHDRSIVPSWTAWNYSGYERKTSYREYHDVVQEMARLGEINGCGRAMWEYSPGLDRYGTPMALMLLPHWTNGCIGSMEGLYFESSATTPFHFLNQSMLSEAPSRAQRDLPYQDFDIDRGISQLQVMGVRYYMAQSDGAIAAAREHDDLTEVAEAQPFVIFEVARSDVVEGLAVEPVVVSGQAEEQLGELANRFDIGWLGQAVTFYNDPASYQALPAEDGPDDWERVETLLPADGEAIEPVTVSDVVLETSRISFTVDEVGSPVLVKASFFPNWSVSGADGPWRIGPNLMVVVPTQNDVELSYGRTAVDWLGIVLALAGLAALAALAALDRQRWARTQAAEVWEGDQLDWNGELKDLVGRPQLGGRRRQPIISGRALAGRLTSMLDPSRPPPGRPVAGAATGPLPLVGAPGTDAAAERPLPLVGAPGTDAAAERPPPLVGGLGTDAAAGLQAPAARAGELAGDPASVFDPAELDEAAVDAVLDAAGLRPDTGAATARDPESSYDFGSGSVSGNGDGDGDGDGAGDPGDQEESADPAGLGDADEADFPTDGADDDGTAADTSEELTNAGDGDDDEGDGEAEPPAGEAETVPLPASVQVETRLSTEVSREKPRSS